MRRILLALCMVGLVCAQAGIAQAPDDGQLYQVFEYRVGLEDIPAYEDGLKQLFAVYKKSGVNFPTFTSVSVTEPGLYTFVLPLSSMAAFDDQQAQIQKAWDASGEVLVKLGQISQSNHGRIVAYSSAGSYVPASPRLSAEESMYWATTFLYPKPSGQFAPVMEEWVALYKKHGITTGFGTFGLVIGGEGPLLAIRIGGKNAADLHAEEAKIQAKIGAEGQALIAKGAPMLRRVETIYSQSRPDLSYQP